MEKKEQELRQERTDAAKKMADFLDKAEDEKRSMTPEEKAEYDKLDKRIDAINEYIEKRGKSQKIVDEKDKVIDPIPTKINIDHKMTYDPDKEFKNIGEYFYTMVSNPSDKRLTDLRADQGPKASYAIPKFSREQRAQSMGTGTEGGFAMPEVFRPEVLQIQPQEAIIRPRATVIPAGSPPDAKLTMPALDQGSAQNIYGGVVITHTGEGITMTETDVKLREVTMEPKELSAYIITTNKLLSNWDAASTFITTQLRKAMNGAEDYDFMRGDGINKALGFINAPAAITITRSATVTIAYVDVLSMFARAKQGGSLLWISSQTCIPQLSAIVDSGGHAIWIGGGNLTTGIAGPMPSSLLGIPLMFADRVPALGTKGDLNLVDLNYYLIKDGSGPFAALSTELLFLSNRTVFKIVWNVDAKPWINEAMPIEGSTTNTVSPFVNLSTL